MWKVLRQGVEAPCVEGVEAQRVEDVEAQRVEVLRHRV